MRCTLSTTAGSNVWAVMYSIQGGLLGSHGPRGCHNAQEHYGPVYEIKQVSNPIIFPASQHCTVEYVYSPNSWTAASTSPSTLSLGFRMSFVTHQLNTWNKIYGVNPMRTLRSRTLSGNLALKSCYDLPIWEVSKQCGTAASSIFQPQRFSTNITHSL